MCPQVSAMVTLSAFCICLFMLPQNYPVNTSILWGRGGICNTWAPPSSCWRSSQALQRSPGSCMLPALLGCLCICLQQGMTCRKSRILIISNHTKSWFKKNPTTNHYFENFWAYATHNYLLMALTSKKHPCVLSLVKYVSFHNLTLNVPVVIRRRN